MPRHTIAYTARGAAVFRNLRTDSGYPLLLMEEAETRKVRFDLTSLLESGETISSASVAASGISASISTASPLITMTVSSPTAWGEAKLTITLSSSEVIKETLRVRQNNRAYDPSEVAYA